MHITNTQSNLQNSIYPNYTEMQNEKVPNNEIPDEEISQNTDISNEPQASTFFDKKVVSNALVNSMDCGTNFDVPISEITPTSFCSTSNDAADLAIETIDISL